jgi:hypothetical protein
MYLGGDTVDLQLATNTKADANREEAQQGDLRLSIGNFQGRPTAVLYRKLSAAKKPMVFSSGVVRSYLMDFVDVVSLEKIEVKVQAGKSYLGEAYAAGRLRCDARRPRRLAHPAAVVLGQPAHRHRG